ncbi:hypothetical protein LEN26_011292 [Aphanomyces euteiches]|nr:hypothetical protein AeMF1_013484 [Aphanomyces euteiches]KAH9120096.1 hypothetical protein LEN26_011292 [Aphanomyces euteiches]KAH9184091.1 hypothetical protein AeNC1_013933 [Aphanomyces euteiches]
MNVRAILAALALAAVSNGQQIGTNTPEVHPVLTTQTCTTGRGCTPETSKVVIDANWRWIHQVGSSTNCRNGGSWDGGLCPDPTTCAKNCALDGVDYGAAGVVTSGGNLNVQLNNRMYLLQDDSNYKIYKVLNKEFTFEVDVSKVPCGGNSALYFVPMDQDGGKSKYPNNKAGAAYGTGYCDAQCPGGNAFVNGQANMNNNMGQCCMEMDIWEANSVSNALTPHTCTVDGVYTCVGGDCGVCDKGGCGANPWAMGNHNLYGPGSSFSLDTTKPFTVVTQFITDDNSPNGNLAQINRFYLQNGKKIDNPSSLTDSYCSWASDFESKGGMKAMGRALKSGMVLAISVWTGEMGWLDSGNAGSCPSNPPAVTSAPVSITNIRVGDIGSTTGTTPPPSPPTPSATTTPGSSPPVTTSPPSPPSPPSTSAPSPGGTVGEWGQCGGTWYNGPTQCQSGLKCQHWKDEYWQCIPAVEIWGQCGGRWYNGPTVCQDGLKCQYWKDDYSQCIPQ